jgi:D-alanyl-D-alanine carboxypeptidase/D-alanyl-D-alanine-endopeptidase (penicillin-binding protein 4)
MIRLPRLIRSILLVAAVFVAAAPAGAFQQSLQERVSAELGRAHPGARFGLVVADEDGRELIAINPDSRFIPASNTKMFTTAAAFASMAGLDRPDTAGGASVRLEAGGSGAPDVILAGAGDARLSSSPDCVAATTACSPTSAGARG